MVNLKFKTRLSAYDITAVLIALFYSLVMIHLSLLKFKYFRYTSFDLGIFTQSFAGFLHGRPWFNTVEWQVHGVTSHFGVHFQPIMYALIPLFKLFPSAKTFLVVQSLALGTSVFLAYLLAKKVLNERLALALTGLYAFNSSLIGINLFEFHPVSLAVPLFLLAAVLLVDGREREFFATSAILLSVKEDTFLGVASLSLWWAFRDGFSIEELEKNRRFLVFAAIPVLYGVIVIKLIIPYFGKGYIYGSLYKHVHLTGRKLAYFLLFNLSFGLLPLFLPRNWVLLTLPWLENLLASRASQYSFGFHYPYMLVPLSFLGTVYVLKELEFRHLKRILSVLLVLGFITSWATMPIAETPPKEPFSLVYYSILEPLPGYKTAWEVIDVLLKTNLSIYTQPAFYPALAVKENVYVYPAGIKPDLVFVDVRTYHGRLYLKRLREMVRNNYVLVYSKNGIELYARSGLKLPLPLKELKN
ncbi:DUF2079 domain-containing protein [Thermococcus sp. 9N3]|uniref:DUF2079 domain-containing protein n=1 Tax=Thermococcus sp. 9N3 TaxID=163002 RepID=UPI0014321B99|nr:DUF2079 domain-containing protein [Thermococcus sp. 9N3]NJE49778.1 DUF2079 domain-containing protein [Thermococcus sp. 9N3]